MNKRINFKETLPSGYDAMLQLVRTVKPATLTPLQTELIKIRASQINGCAYCLDMHLKVARNLGETQQRLDLLPAWEDTSLYTEQEKAIFALTEEITRIEHGVKDETYAAAAKLLEPVQIAEVIMTAAVINTWNRILRATLAEPENN